MENNNKVRKPSKLAIVVPCYNEEEILDITIKELTLVLKKLIKKQKILDSSFVC
jgi:hypothetical protein